MFVSRVSILTGKITSRDLPITPDQLADWKFSKRRVQEAFPHLSAEDQEYLLNGTTRDEWLAAHLVDGPVRYALPRTTTGVKAQ